MKSYPPIPGFREFLGLRCWAFRKLDGSNLRFEWSPKRGWYKYGTRTRLFDHTDLDFGGAIPVFRETYGDALIRALEVMRVPLKNGVIAYCEFFGPRTFAGMHEPDDPKQVLLFDLNVNKHGFLVPEEFLRVGDHVPTAELLHTGHFDLPFVEQVRSGAIGGDGEGVVAKGFTGRKQTVHNLWMAKVKTRWWLQRLREHAALHGHLGAELAANTREQEDTP